MQHIARRVFDAGYPYECYTQIDKSAKAEDFNVGDKVLRWDSRREDKGKHAKFDFLWRVPLSISVVQGNNTYFLRSVEDCSAEEGPVNGRMLKHYHDPF